MALWEPINGVYTATTPLLPWAASIFNINAEWGSALISAGFGAGIGAWMAGRIARHSKLRDELLAEIRSIDVATTICIAIIDLAGGLKKQYAIPLINDHQTDLIRFALYKADEERTKPFQLKINNRKLQTIAPPITELQSLVFNHMNVSPNGVKSTIALADAIANLNNIINAYNEILERFKRRDLPEGFTPEHYYLAIAVRGVTNHEYASAIQGIASYVDDVIFFAYKLSTCLTQQGVIVSKDYKRLSGENHLPRKIEIFDENSNLIPSDLDYQDWMKGWEVEPDATAKRKNGSL